jgi:hypothetical protein
MRIRRAIQSHPFVIDRPKVPPDIWRWQPQVSEESGTVNVKTEIVNDSHTAKSATVRTRVLDAKAKPVAEVESTQTVAAHATAVFDQTSPPVANPELWHPEPDRQGAPWFVVGTLNQD